MGAALLALTFWEIAALLIHQRILLVTPVAVAKRLCTIWQVEGFARAIWFSFYHIAGGFLLGLILGCLLAYLAAKHPVVETLLWPWMATIKSVPVASFVVICLIWLSARNLSVFISFLIVIPIIYQNVLEGLRAENRYGTLVLSRRAADAPRGFCYALPLEEEIFISEAGIAVLATLEEKNLEISDETCTNVFDYDKIKHTLFCRTRRQGDVIPLQKGRKKIKELFIDEKIPRAERERYPLLAAGDVIIWVPGLRQAYGADEQTIRKVWIQIRRV